MKVIKQFYKNRREIQNPEMQKLNEKVLKSYILHRVILGKDEWNITFKGKPIHSKIKMAQKWANYAGRKVFSVIETIASAIKDDGRTMWAPMKPINATLGCGYPDETAFEYILQTINMEIIDEVLYGDRAVYTIRLKE